jgi:acyl-CoA thioester hydrolase
MGLTHGIKSNIVMIEGKGLTNITEVGIRFCEVDAMGVVWHGNYVKYLEDGREAFGKQYQFAYYDVYKQGLMTPIVKLDIDYKQMLKYGEKIIIETKYVPTEAAKIIFLYKLINTIDNSLVITAKTTQVFIDKQGELQLTNPTFYIEWQKKWGLL